ncbi:hypothetical protein [Novosphingobium mangrovi (ex Huang et al. 2023)]|uniref:Uncharacterized protein n=1 Tax=Novosphingobium mangrovi (ex Huang et al. 2023) TaxID=2976432 RepID=A0ABT2I0J5_9SPHN|nr:hypothetical protein [Novosphingobium mangrovi (ex Huang et al. 2023)]MCT2398324.1 hypothetical protein [Novosphingobium mangrovi (ex Huang et al. 2023)]
MTMTDWDELKADVERFRDEARVQAHLASKDAQDQWAELEDKWHEFARKAELAKSGEGIRSAIEVLGDELKQAYERIKKSV